VTEPTGTSQDVTRDAWLAVRCQLGEREAFDSLIDRWHGPLWTYARRLTGSDDAAHEVVQGAWRILRGLPGLRDAARLRPWLFGIARRTLMDRLRGQYAAPRPSDVDPDTLATGSGAFSGSGDDCGSGVDEAGLLAGLAGLPVVEREVLTLFYLEELSLADVAGLLGVPAGTVKSRLHRARRMLRQAIASTEGNAE
jgi:RNA polymerase sigma-70 factor (ECF subfamily)